MQANCVKVVENSVKSGWIQTVKNLKIVNNFTHFSSFKRVFQSFPQQILTLNLNNFSLLNGSFTLFPHTSTNTTIYIKGL
jgi:hypothetical protein